MLMISLMELQKNEEHCHAHRLLGECLKRLGIRYDDSLKLIYSDHGKPFLADYPEVHFNITHAKGISACMVSSSECGIDAEAIRPYRPNVVKRAFSKKETELIEKASGAERDELFFRIWTLKESYVKAIGTGISYPLSSLEFTFDRDTISSNVRGFSFRQYIIKNRYIIAICKRI